MNDFLIFFCCKDTTHLMGEDGPKSNIESKLLLFFVDTCDNGRKLNTLAARNITAISAEA